MAAPSTDNPLDPPSQPSQGAGSERRKHVVRIGDTVIVRLDDKILRPMLVTFIGEVPIEPLTSSLPPAHVAQLASEVLATPMELRASGTIFCEPEDHTTHALRSVGLGSALVRDPARIHGRPDRHHPLVYAELLKPGTGIGEWRPRLPL